MTPHQDEIRAVPFEELGDADLVLDATYAGGARGNAGDDPLARLLPVGNQGGFRYAGSPLQQSVRLVVLYTSGRETDWPDFLDPVSGDFTYYGDNRSPGRALHETRRSGNALLRDIFAWSQEGPESRLRVPPILLFEKTGHGREVRFRGLLAPGSPRLSPEEELVAVWRTTQEHRFQNYRSHFTVLKVDRLSRAWIDEVLAGRPLGPECPAPWNRWVKGRIYEPLEAPRTLNVRSRTEQLPTREPDRELLGLIHSHFSPDPHQFENFAVDTWLASDDHVGQVDVTRPSRDGGRDAVGAYMVGPRSDPVAISFALEAKCYAPFSNSVGVREVARLISRIKHRDFGVFVTTSFVNDQAYREVREDGHPVVFITGRDIIDILRDEGIRTPAALLAHLQEKYPVSSPEHTTSHVDVNFPDPDVLAEDLGTTLVRQTRHP